MKLPISIAAQIQQMLEGIELPSSKVKHVVINKLVEDGLVIIRQVGRTRQMYSVRNNSELRSYLSNQFGIDDLASYIEKYNSEDLTRAEAIVISSTSKLRRIRTFKGFPVNCYEPIVTSLNSEQLTIFPAEGSFIFIHDYEFFKIPENVTVVGIENPENFRWVAKQKDLFSHLHPLFVSRYPQSNDLVKWLGAIPNNYLHFGDFDFEGINIYLSEYKKHLDTRASFFTPQNIDDLIHARGNRDLYNKQLHLRPNEELIEEDPVKHLLQTIHQHKKVLEQEYLITSKRAPESAHFKHKSL